MRTSYRSSHEEDNNAKVSLEENIEKEAEKIYDSTVQENNEEKKRDIVFAYRSIMNEKLENEEKDQAEEAAENVEQEEQEKKEKSGKEAKKIVIGIISFLIVVIGGIVVYNTFIKQDNSIEAIQDRVDSLYTSAKKEDIKSGVSVGDLDKYYLDLNDAQEKGEDTSAISTELDTIGYFISDKEMLTEYDSEDYDLTSSGLQDSLNSIKENSETYTVPGLAVTISDLCTKVNGDYETFIALRSEMQGITDATSFDEEGYKARIANVRHKPNQQELNAIYDNIVADKQAAEAEQALKDAATEEAQEQAQKALEEAQKAQQETQQKLEEAEKKLQEKANDAKEGISDVIDNITGSDEEKDTNSQSE